MNINNIDLKRAYEVSTKGLCIDASGKILVIQDDDGWWELPGGGLDHGEDPLTGLKRECIEELGVECEVLDEQPYKVFVGLTEKDVPRMSLLFRIKLLGNDFKLNPEAIQIKFVTSDEFKQLKLVPQLNKLKEIL